jgi:hypothetical protein
MVYTFAVGLLESKDLADMFLDSCSGVGVVIRVDLVSTI